VGRNLARMGSKINVYTTLVGKAGGNRATGNSYHKRKFGSNMDDTDITLRARDRFHLA
jgi:hypothetical protein